MTTSARVKRGLYPETRQPMSRAQSRLRMAGWSFRQSSRLEQTCHCGKLSLLLAGSPSVCIAIRCMPRRPAAAILCRGSMTLLSTMQNGRALGQSGRFTQLEPVIRRSFDIAAMARLSVGPTWASLTEAQRQQLTESFGRYMSAIYADRFGSYAGQRLVVTGEQPAPSGVMVRSQIIKANGEPVKVDYMMRLSGDNWLISDIYLDGAISEVATRRSEFAAILKTEGVDGLTPALNRKAEVLAMSAARTF